MKGLFLIWHRSQRALDGFYEFTPYMYGPCSFDLYEELERAEQEHLVAQAPHSVVQWASYHLTVKGEAKASTIEKNVDKNTLALVQSIATEVASLGFHKLLRKVYAEAPDFASRTVLPREVSE